MRNNDGNKRKRKPAALIPGMDNTNKPQPRTRDGRFSFHTREDGDITLTPTYDISDDCIVLPDPVWVMLQQARATTTDPAHIAHLTDRLYDWTHANGWVGTPLDDRDALDLFQEFLEFETPDWDVVAVPVHRAELLAQRFADKFPVAVHEVEAGRWLVEMDNWPSYSGQTIDPR